MTATWSVNKKIFLQNAITVKNNQPLMAVVELNAYHYDLEFAVTQFIHAGIDTFSTTSLREKQFKLDNLLQESRQSF